MARRVLGLILCFYCALLVISSAQANLFPTTPAKQPFAPIDQAFTFDFQQEPGQLQLKWQILPGYYLYQHKITLVPTQATLGKVAMPTGITHRDEFFGTVQIYKGQLILNVPLLRAEKDSSLTINYQGCAEAGYCYPPETRTIPLSTVQQNTAQSSVTTTPVQTMPIMGDSAAPAHLPFSPLWAFLVGILIAFTPCVLPMYPLISGLILGREKALSSRRVGVLTIVYVQGMALTYTLLGLVVAAIGLQFQAALQHPYVLVTLSLFFILLALSMFGLYSLQLPSNLQTRLASLSNTQSGGSVWGVLVMGAIAGLICSPCTTAPLSAILLYIAQSGNLLAGGITLYLYALGMGLPLITVALFGHRLLPRSGPWMQYVKESFGFVILTLPVFLLERLLGDPWGLRLWALLGVAFFGWGFILCLRSSRAGWRVLQLILFAAALICVRPLQDWLFGTPEPQQAPMLAFKSISSSNDLELALTGAKGQTVMLDLYADWCVACKEYQKYTFSDPAVQQQLSSLVLLKADVTANNAEHQTLYKKLKVTGLPTLIFFDPQGNELRDKRISGFLPAPAFQQHMRSLYP